MKKNADCPGRIYHEFDSWPHFNWGTFHEDKKNDRDNVSISFDYHDGRTGRGTVQGGRSEHRSAAEGGAEPHCRHDQHSPAERLQLRCRPTGQDAVCGQHPARHPLPRIGELERHHPHDRSPRLPTGACPRRGRCLRPGRHPVHRFSVALEVKRVHLGRGTDLSVPVGHEQFDDHRPVVRGPIGGCPENRWTLALRGPGELHLVLRGPE